MLPLVCGRGTSPRRAILARGLSSVAAERAALLRKVYAPFAKIDKKSPENSKLALSGKVWEDYYRPGDSERYGYPKLQQAHMLTLREIDSLKESMKSPTSTIVETLVAEYAHQSVAIEDNKLKLGDSIIIKNRLSSTLFKEIDIASTSIDELCDLSLPDAKFLLPDADASQTAELRNHIIASHWVTEAAIRSPGTPGLTEDEIKRLSALIIKGTDSEALYWLGWGQRVNPGEYRQTPIMVKNNPLCIFPYHPEVPELMRRFFEWRAKVTSDAALHPLIVACQATVYFLHIHPFPDGNGRVSRLMMQDYLIRHGGYVPVVIQGLERKDYLRMIKDASDGDPGAFVAQILGTQLEMMQTFMMREFRSL